VKTAEITTIGKTIDEAYPDRPAACVNLMEGFAGANEAVLYFVNSAEPEDEYSDPEFRFVVVDQTTATTVPVGVDDIFAQNMAEVTGAVKVDGGSARIIFDITVDAYEVRGLQEMLSAVTEGMWIDGDES
jgi:hypothetical protein